jgi:glycosyltransferase involved in cell wall biosynthesis
VVTRDGAKTIGITLDSILNQTVPPKFCVVVNDGSTDNTIPIVESRRRAFKEIYLLNTNSRTRDIRRVPKLLNLGLEFAEKGGRPRTSYMMVSGDDNDLSRTYAQEIMEEMDRNPRIAVASGDWIGPQNSVGEKMPHGGGRFVRMSLMNQIGERYPVAYGWETWLLYKAMQLGYLVKIYPRIRYAHLRPFQPGNLTGWGRAMYSLGFPAYFVMLRFVVNFFLPGRGTQSRKSAVTMFAGFISAKVNPAGLRGMLIDDRPLKNYVKYVCTARLSRLI